MTWKNTIRKSGIAKREVKFDTNSRAVSVTAENYGGTDLIDLDIVGDVTLDWELEAVSYDEVRLQINKLGFFGTGSLMYEDDSRDTEMDIDIEIPEENIKVELIIQAEPSGDGSLSFQVGVFDIQIEIDFKGQTDISKADLSAKVQFE